MKITSIGAPTTYIQEPRGVEGVGKLGQSAGTGPQGAFGDKLAEAVDRVSDQQLKADDKLIVLIVLRVLLTRASRRLAS